MAWQTELTLLLRYLIGDVDSSDYEYTDSRLQTTIVVAANYVIAEVDFNTAYTVNLNTMCISPDPTTPTRDEDAIALFTLKAACLLDQVALRKGSQRIGLRIRFGPSELEVKDAALQAQLAMIENGPCDLYEKLKVDFLIHSSISGRAIFSTLTNSNMGTAFT